MKLGAEAMGYDVLELRSIELSPVDEALSNEEKIAKGTDLVVNDNYRQYKDRITAAVERCISLLTEATKTQEAKTKEALNALLYRQRLLVVLTLALVLATIIIDMLLILRHAAEHDSLTRLYNRRAFESLREQFRTEIALLQVDVDYFKTFNDTYGHDVGDKVLQKVAKYLKSSFRSSDYPCRIGGDEFAVIMTGMTPEMRDVVMQKVRLVRDGLQDTSDGLPPVTITVGVSFGNGESADAIFKAADTALYDAKDRGRNRMSYSIDGEIIVGI